MGTLTKGNIVLFPFPYTDLSKRKLRPCLVISEEMYQDIILCQITSRNIPKDTHSVSLQKGNGLQIGSYVRTNMIFTADTRQIVKKVGNIPKKTHREIVKKITHIIS